MVVNLGKEKKREEHFIFVAGVGGFLYKFGMAQVVQQKINSLLISSGLNLPKNWPHWMETFHCKR